MPRLITIILPVEGTISIDSFECPLLRKKEKWKHVHLRSAENKSVSDTFFPLHFISSESKPARLDKTFFAKLNAGGEERTEQAKDKHFHQDKQSQQDKKHLVRFIEAYHKDD